MNVRTGLVAGLLVVGLVGWAGTAGAQDLGVEEPDIQDPNIPSSDGILDEEDLKQALYNTLPAGWTDTLNNMGEDSCQAGLDVLLQQGWSVPATRDRFGYEYDPLTGACKDFRDTLEHRVLNGQAPPYYQNCNYLYGTNCIAFGHYACDFALLVGSGLVYFCLGGVTPYN